MFFLLNWLSSTLRSLIKYYGLTLFRIFETLDAFAFPSRVSSSRWTNCKSETSRSGKPRKLPESSRFRTLAILRRMASSSLLLQVFLPFGLFLMQTLRKLLPTDYEWFLSAVVVHVKLCIFHNVTWSKYSWSPVFVDSRGGFEGVVIQHRKNFSM
jgi:hypothetical protein